MNIQGYNCDYYEVCHDVVKPIAEEVIECCNNKCSADCHSLCQRALDDSGLSTTDNDQTRKKCYGLYTIYGLGPAARWLKGYNHSYPIEKPASIMLTRGIWMCTGYSIEVTTILRSVGYEKNEAFSICGPGHAYNLVKFPGESKYRFVDTVGNGLYISDMIGEPDWYHQVYDPLHGLFYPCRNEYQKPCQNDEVSGVVAGQNCPQSSEIYYSCE